VTVVAREPISTSVATMKAAVITSPRVCEVVDALIPRPRSTEVLVRLEGCGVCASNIPPWEGREWFKYPMAPGALGHEGWGIIDSIGADVMHFAPGQRVAILSQNAYAQYDTVDESNVIALADSLMGQPFPAEPLGCAMNIFKRCQIRAGQTVAILGVGFLGAILTRLTSNANANVIAISRRPFSLQIAHAMGAAHLLPMDDHWQIIEEVRGLTGGQFADVTIEAVGKQWPIDLAGEITRERGRLVIAGYHQDGLRQINMQLWNWRGFDIVSAHERDPKVYTDGMKAALEAVVTGQLDPTPLYTHVLPLEKLGEALDMTASRPDGFLKALIKM